MIFTQGKLGDVCTHDKSSLAELYRVTTIVHTHENKKRKSLANAYSSIGKIT